MSRFPPRLELSFSDWTVVEAFPALTFDDPVFLAPAPGTDHLVVAEREGKIFAFEHHGGATSKQLVLDLSGQNQGEDDGGLLGFAFHPRFDAPEEADVQPYLYAGYAYTPEPIVGEKPPQATQTVFRLSRFTVDRDTLVADPGSELVLIEQLDESVWHQGGAMFFHPDDGFLYLTLGDEGSVHCRLGNCQRIDRDLFGGVLRIDVDETGGDVSHPIARQPETGATAHYYIPNDNPFVGMPGVLEEFYALGLRSPHRLTYDPVDDLAWIGEVGQRLYEEINILRAGANYQWDVREGFEAAEESGGALPDVIVGTWTDPLLALDREEARSIIGGYVYRGRRFPELEGRYVFGDFETGRMWSLRYSVGDDGEVRSEELEPLLDTPFAGRTNGITSFGVDAMGELYILTLGESSKIMQLARAADGGPNVPERLSRTGLFRDLDTLTPRDGLVPYEVNLPLWSDGLHKRRWVHVPDGELASFSVDEPWLFPPGSLFVKHFEYPTSATERAVPVETRVLVIGKSGSAYGLTYAWDGNGEDASLVTRLRSLDLSLLTGDPAAPREYQLPGPQDCLECHHDQVGGVLGLRTAQTNRTLPEGHALRRATGHEQQLPALAAAGLFGPDAALPPHDELPALPSLSNGSVPVEDRLRAYWDVHCAMCHGTKDIRSQWDARISTALDAQGVIDGELVSGDSSADAVVAPGDPMRSAMYLRDVSTDPARRMPPLARTQTDLEYADLLEAWILDLDP